MCGKTCLQRIARPMINISQCAVELLCKMSEKFFLCECEVAASDSIYHQNDRVLM